jgi:hypothetical protein
LGNSHEGLEAYEQLAIYYEHESGETARAAVLVRAALGELRKSGRTGLISSAQHRQYQARFERRLVRLEHTEKAGRSGRARTLLDAIDVESRTAGQESNGV